MPCVPLSHLPAHLALDKHSSWIFKYFHAHLKTVGMNTECLLICRTTPKDWPEMPRRNDEGEQGWISWQRRGTSCDPAHPELCTVITRSASPVTSNKIQ